jgi:translation initiation factor 1A
LIKSIEVGKMPKNEKGGKNFKKGKRIVATVRQLVYKDEGQDYGLVKKKMGDCRFMVVLQTDAREIICHVRGKMRKREWVNEHDIVLVGLRDYEDGKADIIHKYSSDDANVLRKTGVLTMKGAEEKNDDDEEDEIADSIYFQDDAPDIDLDDL